MTHKKEENRWGGGASVQLVLRKDNLWPGGKRVKKRGGLGKAERGQGPCRKPKRGISSEKGLSAWGWGKRKSLGRYISVFDQAGKTTHNPQLYDKGRGRVNTTTTKGRN